MGIESALAEWAVNVPSTHGPEAIGAAHDAITDIIACIIGGANDPSTRAIAKVAGKLGRGVALGMGTNLRLPAPVAALVTGTAAHALDYDDNFAPATTHATAVLAPALFALAEEERLTGADVVDAYIVGLELQARIGRLVNPVHYEKGWHATSTVGAIGSAGACARLLRLDVKQMLAAMSIAFSMASGSKKQFGSPMKPIHAGLAAKNAVLAARMAEAGISGDIAPLVGRWAFSDLYADRNESALEAEALDRLGSSLAIIDSGLMIKRFPCCGAAHRTLDGLTQLRLQHRLTFESVDHVEAHIPAFARGNLRFDDPQDELEARFSLPYCSARVLQHGRLALAAMSGASVREEFIRPWLHRFVIRIKEGSACDELGANATPAITRIVLNDGSVHEIGICIPKGSKGNPLTHNERIEKFRDCCQWVGMSDMSERLLEAAQDLTKMVPIARFCGQLAEAFETMRSAQGTS